MATSSPHSSNKLINWIISIFRGAFTKLRANPNENWNVQYKEKIV
jgi:hypothetical protein